ncbi:hypothetical protein [Sulfurimonas sp. CS5]|uniref:hypothetical protein n=1 Tax=Sulfurimonas sp. CS5 TaxID=3391145 RepID=UPI0039E85787
MDKFHYSPEDNHTTVIVVKKDSQPFLYLREKRQLFFVKKSLKREFMDSIEIVFIKNTLYTHS